MLKTMKPSSAESPCAMAPSSTFSTSCPESPPDSSTTSCRDGHGYCEQQQAKPSSLASPSSSCAPQQQRREWWENECADFEVSPDRPHYYFGYGAMCNPVSRQRRRIEGKHCRAAVLPNFCIDFSNSGAASILEIEVSGKKDDCKAPKKYDASSLENCVHGVLMEFHDPVMWEKTLASEKGYEHKEVLVYPYNNDSSSSSSNAQDDDDITSTLPEPVLAHVVYMSCKPEKCGTPQERYLKIIAQGLEQHGVCKEYIQTRILSVDSIPSRRPRDFRSFPTVPEPQRISFQEYQERAATTQVCFLLSDRIIDMVGRPSLPGEDQAIMKFLRCNAIGKGDLTPFIRAVFYDPDMAPYCKHDDNDDETGTETTTYPDEEEDCDHLSKIWSRWAENQMVDIFASCYVEGRVTMLLER